MLCVALLQATARVNDSCGDLFKALVDFFKDHDILWQKCVVFCSDGARAMNGSKTGIVCACEESRTGHISYASRTTLKWLLTSKTDTG